MSKRLRNQLQLLMELGFDMQVGILRQRGTVERMSS